MTNGRFADGAGALATEIAYTVDDGKVSIVGVSDQVSPNAACVSPEC